MANTADVISGTAVYGRKAPSMALVSIMMTNCVAMTALGLVSPNKADSTFGPGIPETGIMLSGANITATRKHEVVECSEYLGLVQNVDQRDGKSVGYYDNTGSLSQGSGATYTVTTSNGVITGVTVTAGGEGYTGCLPTLIPVDGGYTGVGAELMPVVTAGVVTGVTVVNGGYNYSGTVTIVENTGKTAGQKAIRPCWKWSHREEYGYVDERDTSRYDALKASNPDMFHTRISELTTDEEARMKASLMLRINSDCLNGTPTTSTDPIWDHQYGFKYAIAADNTYAGLDRTLATNYFWRSKQDGTTHNWTFEKLLSDAHLEKGLAFAGSNVDVFIVSPAFFAKCMSENQSYQVKPSDDSGVANLRAWGYKNVVLKYNTSYMIADASIPVGTVYGLNGKTWFFATKSGKNLAFGKNGWKWLGDQPGGRKAHFNTCEVQYMLVCEDPAKNVKYTAVY
jgi:hypothetical protein